jgi:hypothetical protein
LAPGSPRGHVGQSSKFSVLTVPDAIHARWTSQPEPLLPVVLSQAVGGASTQTTFLMGSVTDGARLIQARRMDVHCRSDESVSIAVKFDGEADCYIFSNESYLSPKWQNPAWRLPLGRYLVRVTIEYDSSKVEHFQLINDGPSLDDLQLIRCTTQPPPPTNTHKLFQFVQILISPLRQSCSLPVYSPHGPHRRSLPDQL